MSSDIEFDETLPDSTTKTLGQEIHELQQLVESHKDSILTKLYNKKEIDIFFGRTILETDWSPDPETARAIPGKYRWNGIEYWIWHEWGFVLSEAQRKWCEYWIHEEVDEFYISGGRDSGKSWLGAILAIYSMVFFNEKYPNYLVSLFAGAKEQGETVFEEHVIPLIIHSKTLRKLLSRYDKIWEQLKVRKRQAIKTYELKILNGARLRVNPTSTKAARSKHPDLLWIDEAVEAEEVRKGKVISSAVSSLTAGHHARTLGTSTVHKNPLGWFATQVKRAKFQMKRGVKTIFTINLSEAGINSKPWLGKDSAMKQQKELARKLSDSTINIDAEFYGLIAGGQGNVFDQDDIMRMLASVERAMYDDKKRIIYSHDPGFGTSLYSFYVWQIDDLNVELIDGEFWYRGSPSKILETIKEYVEKYGDDGEHSCDAAATSTIKYLQEAGYDVQSFSLGARPPGWDMMTEEEKQRYNVDSKTIGNNLTNELLSLGRFFIYPKTGKAKRIHGIESEPEIYPGELLVEQMQTQMINENTGKPEKGNDDMIDSETMMILKKEFGEGAGGTVAEAGRF